MGGDYAVSGVKVFPDSGYKVFTITRDAYGSGSGNTTISIRGQAESFLWDDGVPSWEEYSIPISRSWQHVQIKVEWAA